MKEPTKYNEERLASNFQWLINITLFTCLGYWLGTGNKFTLLLSAFLIIMEGLILSNSRTSKWKEWKEQRNRKRAKDSRYITITY